jgi:hypothetical protein
MDEHYSIPPDENPTKALLKLYAKQADLPSEADPPDVVERAERVRAVLSRVGMELKDLKTASRLRESFLATRDADHLRKRDQSFKNMEKRIKMLKEIVNEPPSQFREHNFSARLLEAAQQDLERLEYEKLQDEVITHSRDYWKNGIEHDHKQLAGENAELHPNPTAEVYRHTSIFNTLIQSLYSELADSGLSKNEIARLIDDLLYWRLTPYRERWNQDSWKNRVRREINRSTGTLF